MSEPNTSNIDEYLAVVSSSRQFRWIEDAGNVIVAAGFETVAGKSLLAGQVTETAMPEPMTIALFGTGFLGLAALRYRRRT